MIHFDVFGDNVSEPHRRAVTATWQCHCEFLWDNTSTAEAIIPQIDYPGQSNDVSRNSFEVIMNSGEIQRQQRGLHLAMNKSQIARL